MSYEYPKYSRAERIADASVHALGVTASLIASAVLIYVFLRADLAHQIPIWVYCAAIVFSFTASAAYHFAPNEQVRPLLRRIDYAAIFVKIAGTYTPLAILLGTGFAYTVLFVIWAFALLGAVIKLFVRGVPSWVTTAAYLGLGWASLVLAWPFVQSMPAATSLLVLAGGLLYTVGVLFHHSELKFSVAIWHTFVLTASICFFAAISVAHAA